MRPGKQEMARSRDFELVAHRLLATCLSKGLKNGSGSLFTNTIVPRTADKDRRHQTPSIMNDQDRLQPRAKLTLSRIYPASVWLIKILSLYHKKINLIILRNFSEI